MVLSIYNLAWRGAQPKTLNPTSLNSSGLLRNTHLQFVLFNSEAAISRLIIVFIITIIIINSHRKSKADTHNEENTKSHIQKPDC